MPVDSGSFEFISFHLSLNTFLPPSSTASTHHRPFYCLLSRENLSVLSIISFAFCPVEYRTPWPLILYFYYLFLREKFENCDLLLENITPVDVRSLMLFTLPNIYLSSNLIASIFSNSYATIFWLLWRLLFLWFCMHTMVNNGIPRWCLCVCLKNLVVLSFFCHRQHHIGV